MTLRPHSRPTGSEFAFSQNSIYIAFFKTVINLCHHVLLRGLGAEAQMGEMTCLGFTEGCPALMT